MVEGAEAVCNEESDRQCDNIRNNKVEEASCADVKKALSTGDREAFIKIDFAAAVQPGESLNCQHGGERQPDHEEGNIIFAQ